MTMDNFRFYLQHRLIQTGGQLYSDTSPFSVPWPNHPGLTRLFNQEEEEGCVSGLGTSHLKKLLVKKFTTVIHTMVK